MSDPPPAPLNDHDVASTFRHVVPSWTIENLDTRLGTAAVVTVIKNGGCGAHGWAEPCEDGPYSSGSNAEWWSREGSRDAKGFTVTVFHKTRASREERIVRRGRLTWNQLANMATGAALDLKRGPVIGQQTRLF